MRMELKVFLSPLLWGLEMGGELIVSSRRRQWGYKSQYARPQNRTLRLEKLLDFCVCVCVCVDISN